MSLIGSILKSNQFNFPLPDTPDDVTGVRDPRTRFGTEDVATRRKNAKKRRKLGEFKPLEPGQDLELRGLNEFQEASRRGKRAADSFEGEARQVGLSEAVAKARQDAGRSTDLEAASLRRRQSGLGLQLSERQQRAQRRRIGLSRAVNEASAAGSTRRTFADNATAARRAAGGLENEIFNLENAGLQQLANAEGQAQIIADNKAAAKKQNKIGAAGSVVGIAASLFSSEDYKHDKKPATGLLDKLKAIRVENWKYRGDDHTNHIGPYAQEFNDAFGVGQDDKQKISIIDMLGVTLGAVKELGERVDG